jgi:hypothetical protein
MFRGRQLDASTGASFFMVSASIVRLQDMAATSSTLLALTLASLGFLWISWRLPESKILLVRARWECGQTPRTHGVQ